MAVSALDWEATFRELIRDAVGPGWSVFRQGKAIRLRVRTEQGSESVTLPYPWAASSIHEALPRIKEIAKVFIEDGVTLVTAASDTELRSSRAVTDWAGALDAYKHLRCVFEGRVSERTWRVKYEPVLRDAVTVMMGPKRPADTADLCERVLIRWAAGTRQRTIMRQSLYGFLRFCVERQHFRACWTPPPAPKESRLPKRIGYPFTDAQIIRLLDALPSDEAGARWRFAFQLMAVYGLRPEELRFLVPEERVDGLGIRCIYRKSTGRGEKTQPRPLHPLLVRDLDGTPQDWRLALRLAAGELLPSIGKPGHGGEAVLTYLRRQSIWHELKAEAAALTRGSETLTPYGFRHRYAKASHAAKVSPKDVADAMGHTLEVHLQAYARFASTGVADAYAMANAVGIAA
jgi:integrase